MDAAAIGPQKNAHFSDFLSQLQVQQKKNLICFCFSGGLLGFLSVQFYSSIVVFTHRNDDRSCILYHIC